MSKARTTMVAAAVALGAAGWAVPVAAATSAGPGCQDDRRAVVYTQSQVAGRGSWLPCVVDTGMTSGESGLAIDSKGTLLRSVATSPTGIAVSTDKGATWQRRLLPEGAQSGIADGWLDPATDRYFYTGLGDSPAYFSDDRGRTWGTGTFDSTMRQDWNKVFSGRPVVRRASGYPSNIYYCNLTAPGGVATTVRCYSSTDGGKTFRTTGADPHMPQVCADPTQYPSANHGRGIVDPHDGTIYVPANVCGHIDLAVSADEGRTWTHRIIGPSQGHGTVPVVGIATAPELRDQLLAGRVNPVNAYLSAGLTTDVLAMDDTGRLSAVWLESGTYLPYLSTSTDGGNTWSPRIRVSPPGELRTVLPSLTTTRQGRLGLSYYGSTDQGATWTGYLTVIDKVGSRTPVLQTAAVTRAGKPLMTEPCCWANGAQEYTAARWAPDGSLWAAFAGSRPSGDAQGFVGRLVPRS